MLLSWEVSHINRSRGNLPQLSGVKTSPRYVWKHLWGSFPWFSPPWYLKTRHLRRAYLHHPFHTPTGLGPLKREFHDANFTSQVTATLHWNAWKPIFISGFKDSTEDLVFAAVLAGLGLLLILSSFGGAMFLRAEMAWWVGVKNLTSSLW